MHDEMTLDLLKQGRLTVDTEHGRVYAPKSNTPERPVGARTKKGYLRVCLNVEGKQHHFMVHRIVWVAAHGPVPDGYQIDHVNAQKDDNRIANLEAVPGIENMRRGAANGCFKNVGRKGAPRDGKGRFRPGRLLDGRTWDEYPEVRHG